MPANLYENVPSDLPGELVETLTEGKGHVRIERIVSRGHSTPPGQWYDQDTREWVALLQGRATLVFEEADKTVEMIPGDWIEIPKHCRHRVESTATEGDTVWLAVHFH